MKRGYVKFAILHGMRHTKTGAGYVLVLQKGENVIESITSFCAAEGIENAHFSAIGAVEFVSCGYYALNERKYYFTQYNELLEVASGTGNVMLKNGAPFVHLHAVFTNTRNEAFGGHVEEMRVGVTLEVMLTPLPSSLSREHDEDIGLFLISCGS